MGVAHGDDTRVLLVEDDRQIAEQALIGLQRHGMSVTHVITGRGAIERAGTVDVLLLDLGLPDLDGGEVCRRIRASSQVPIIVLSARTDERDRVAALNAGADDYLVKPYGLLELVARIHAVLRRTDSRPAGWRVEAGAIVIDRQARVATYDGRELSLTAKELDLLSLLAQHKDELVERRTILDEVWGGPWHGTGRTLDVHVAALRKKLGNPALIETVRGVGLRLKSRP